MMIKATTTAKRWAILTGALAGMIVLSGCHMDMWTQHKVRAQATSEFFADGQGSRPLVEHAVARSQYASNDPFYTGYSGGKPVDKIPAKAIAMFKEGPKAMILRGQDRFNINCSPCHGKLGNGQGMIALRGRCAYSAS